MNIQEFLGRQNIGFDLIDHYPTYSAQRMAHEVHVSGKDVAKTVLLRTDSLDRYVVAVLPANRKLNFRKVANALGCNEVDLATEIEIAERCTDCEIGVLPPFGSQYGMRTIVDFELVEEEEIVFEGNTHQEAIRMTYKDYDCLERPLRGNIVYGND